MLRLFKYLKPYTLLILISIALLFVQANADLALPDYLSNIVNVGIQQGGISGAVPEAIRQSEMDRLTIFMSPEEKDRVLSNITLVDSSSADYAAKLELYPALSGEPVYVLNEVASSEIDWLNPVMGKAFLIVSGIEQIMTDPARAAAMGAGMGFDLTQLPPGTDLFTVLSRLPAEQIAQLGSTFDARFEALGENMVVQAAVAPVKAEYAASGWIPRRSRPTTSSTPGS